MCYSTTRANLHPDFLNFDPADLTRTNALLFFTLGDEILGAGVRLSRAHGAYPQTLRGNDEAELVRFVITRDFDYDRSLLCCRCPLASLSTAKRVADSACHFCGGFNRAFEDDRVRNIVSDRSLMSQPCQQHRHELGHIARRIPYTRFHPDYNGITRWYDHRVLSHEA